QSSDQIFDLLLWIWHKKRAIVHTIFKLGERMAAIGQTKRENGSTRGKKRDSKSQCRRDW
ncbi:MAG: hypothetical protein PHQ39_05125, partial [Methanothrix soehngenii]|nr:hypothetical protein [Methanothrix soehngenii]